MNKNAGFTLIELLVVVLIIGILAAVSLPQYEKAVFKSRAAEAEAWISNAVKAMEVYKLANPGVSDYIDFYAAGFSYSPMELDITLPNLKEWNCSVSSTKEGISKTVAGCYHLQKGIILVRELGDSSKNYCGKGGPFAPYIYIEDQDILCTSLGYTLINGVYTK